MKKFEIPPHLSRYLVDQDYHRYSDIDHTVWRFIMRRLMDYLSKNAHECYLEGLAKTGITTDEIPRIEVISEKIQKFGWKAVAVSGFIPPAAFMELQSLGILPIACDMRTLEHAMYTPAPDIVHEAAGHAPILIHPEFARYLHDYASAAKMAIINREDLDVYEAIRVLSDLKENPNSTPEQVAAANEHLEETVKKASEPSEAALLARMNWWTAEYGLIGGLENPKIYGAGLLSSVGESASALESKTKKIPFSLECLNYSYDITEPQPQLFVTPDFATLTKALHEFSKTMAYQTGGIEGLNKAVKAKTVNTVELDSGVQVSGVLKNFLVTETSRKLSSRAQAAYLQFEGPTQLAFDGHQIERHGVDYHKHGFGSPLGRLRGSHKKLSQFSTSDLTSNGLIIHNTVILEFESGVLLRGRLEDIKRIKDRIVILSFSECTVTLGSTTLFDPDWGTFDMVTGCEVISVFSGAADREAYGQADEFVNKKVAAPVRDESWKELNEVYSTIRSSRFALYLSHPKASWNPAANEAFHIICEKVETKLGICIENLNKKFPDDWLSRLDILEICVKYSLSPKGLDTIQSFIARRSSETTPDGQGLRDGLALIERGV